MESKQYIDASAESFQEVKCLILHDQSTDHSSLIQFQKAFRSELDSAKDFETPFHNVLCLPSFQATNFTIPNPMISRIINKSNFNFVVYLGVMTKEIAIYCGLDTYTGPVIDHSIVSRLESFKNDVETELYQKMGRIVAILYAQNLFEHFPEYDQVTIHRVDKNILNKHAELSQQITAEIKG